jgi:hypothetical protein
VLVKGRRRREVRTVGSEYHAISKRYMCDTETFQESYPKSVTHTWIDPSNSIGYKLASYIKYDENKKQTKATKEKVDFVDLSLSFQVSKHFVFGELDI